MSHTYHFLIVEDAHAVASVLRRLVTRQYPTSTIQTIATGDAAFATYIDTGANAIIVNHGIPGLVGPDLIRLIRARGDTLPIIGISTNPLHLQEYISAGATAFLCELDVVRKIRPLLVSLLPP